MTGCTCSSLWYSWRCSTPAWPTIKLWGATNNCCRVMRQPSQCHEAQSHPCCVQLDMGSCFDAAPAGFTPSTQHKKKFKLGLPGRRALPFFTPPSSSPSTPQAPKSPAAAAAASSANQVPFSAALSQVQPMLCACTVDEYGKLGITQKILGAGTTCSTVDLFMLFLGC